MTYTPRTAFSGLRLWLFLMLLAVALPVQAKAQQENRLRRIQILPHAGFTRINLFFEDPPEYALQRLPGRLRLSVRRTNAPSFRKFRAYSDAQLAGLFCSARGGGLRIDLPLKQSDPGVQLLATANPSVLSLDISAAPRRAQQADILPGREPILSGTEKFVREYGVPVRAGLPFAPTDQEKLKGLLSAEELKQFQLGEVLLYKEKGSEALQIFSAFLSKAPTVRAIAMYRLAGALALLERNDEALKAFRQAEAMWPAYLEQAPELMQTYAEVRAKSGDYPGGRALLVRLINRLSGTVYVAPLLNLLAEMTDRHGEVLRAIAIYRNVIVHAPGTAAAGRAAMKIADHEMFSLARDRYPALLQRYRSIYESPGDFSLRDEALFKMALLHALYGPAQEALEAAITYDRRYPRGIFSTILKKMREELLLPCYRELYAAHDDAALLRLAQENKEYLTRCFSDPDFAQRLSHSFHVMGKLSQEITLFGYLAERDWAAGSAPLLMARMVEDALGLGQLPLADSSARSFLARFPADARAQWMHEQLGRIAFERGDLKAVVAQLDFLNGKGNKSELAESDYYLGKALSAAGDNLGTERSLARFTAAAPGGSPLLVDGYFTLGGARSALRQYQEALAAYRQGEKLASGERADQFLYKTGELYLQMKMVPQATEAWEKLAGRSGGNTWGKLAAEALSDLKWRLKISSELP